MERAGSKNAFATQPLSGIRVIDFTTLLPGPLATLMLAEAGAEVVKIERPGGDDIRRIGPRLSSGEGALFVALNRGKRLVTLDLHTTEGKDAARELISRADVLVEQNRPGVMARLGLGYEELAEHNRRLIYCSITGYGQNGRRAQLAGHDLNYLADTGLLTNVWDSQGAPRLPPTLLADIGCGAMPAVLNVLLALRQREQSGEGCYLDVAMVDGLMMFQVLSYADMLACGCACLAGPGLLTGGSPRYRLYKAADERWLAVAALEEKFWDAFCDGIGLEQHYRGEGSEALATAEAIARILKQRPAAEWLQVFDGRDACLSLVRTFAEAVSDPDIHARGLFDWALQSDASDAEWPALPVPIHRGFRESPSAADVSLTTDRVQATGRSPPASEESS